MVKIIADSTCDLSAKQIADNNIDILPLYVLLGDKTYKDDKKELTTKEAFAWCDANKTTPKTSAPPVPVVAEKIRPYVEAGDEVIIICISSELSGTCQNVKIAAAEFPADKVYVVDSRHLSTGIGLQVLAAAEMANQGIPAKEIYDHLQTMIPRIRTSFVIDTTLYMYRGGRCSSFTNIAAGALRIKPQLRMERGKLVPATKYRGKLEKAVMNYVEDQIPDMLKADKKRIFITHSGGIDDIIEMIRQRIDSLHYFDEICVTDAGLVIASHCGPGTVGVLYTGEDDLF